MLEQLTTNISQYGYFAIFLLIFLQEVGFPSPIPNELVLLFSGYLSFTGALNLPLVVISVIAGDLLSSSILFLVFYFFGKIIITRKPKWLPLPQNKLDHISAKIQVSGYSYIFIGRLTPLIKGYVTVLCGLMRISPSKYGIIMLFTSIIWSSAYVCGGYLAGPYWNLIIQNDTTIKYLVLLIPAGVIVIIILMQVLKKIFSTSKQLQQ